MLIQDRTPPTKTTSQALSIFPADRSGSRKARVVLEAFLRKQGGLKAGQAVTRETFLFQVD
jgi:hypothetical protein